MTFSIKFLKITSSRNSYLQKVNQLVTIHLNVVSFMYENVIVFKDKRKEKQNSNNWGQSFELLKIQFAVNYMYKTILIRNYLFDFFSLFKTSVCNRTK